MKAMKLFVLPMLMIFCASTLVAQEEKKDDGKKLEKMSAKLCAVWAGDKEKTKAQIDKMDDLDLDENMINMILDQIGGIEVEFNKDGSFDVSFGGQEMSGEWEAKKIKTVKMENSLVIFTVTDEDAGGEEKNFEIKFIGDQHMMMTDIDEGGPPIIMKRKKAEKKDKKDK